MEEPPIFNCILAAGSDPSDRSVTVVLGTDETNGIRVDVQLGLVGPLMAALAAEAAKLNAALSEEERSQSATLNAQAVWLSQDLEGSPMLVFELNGGTLLPMAMRSGDFAGLAAEMSLLAGKPAGASH